MTCLNVWIDQRRSRALVAADSLATQRGQQAEVGVSKMIILPHVSALVASRGDLTFFMLLGLYAALPCNSFDELTDALPAKLVEAWRRHQTHKSFPAGDADELGQDIVVVGWSEKRGCIRAITYDHDKSPDGDFSELEIPTVYRAPFDESLKHLALPSTPSSMTTLVRAQAALIKAKRPDHAAGGDIVMACVSRGSVWTTTEKGSINGC